MYIHQAIRATTPEESCIHRTAWDDILFPGRELCIDPTDECVCCVCYTVDGRIGPCWNPQASDLLADDWEPCPRPAAQKVSEKTEVYPVKRKGPFAKFFFRLADRK